MIGEPVVTTLRHAGYAVDWAQDVRDAELSLVHDVCDLVLLDLGLPKADGIDVLARYRPQGGRAPVLILTARDTIEKRIAGLDAGADDYVVKPFDLDELAARLRALLRRRAGRSCPAYSHGALVLDPASRNVTLNGELLSLGPREFCLLRALIEEPMRLNTRSELEDKLYGWGEEISSNAIEVHVHGLRRKLGAEQIVTVRGGGYRLKQCE
ncbi:DNA-binding response regulator [Paraburkholderia steynii]|uniref:DNA-binding response regulator n=1 Tax=Paraburkholderia steynii TaxID=1245441 RepID=A0A4R0X518_9BURK|nr:DNA-binding response regulator [Paraburkholderia steynii]